MKETVHTQKKANVKNSILAGGLIGTAGLFVAKFVGLLYSVPLSSILGSDELMSAYGGAFQIYTYILNIFTAGFPFAISTLVAKYTVLKDSRSLVKIHLLATFWMQVLGFAGMMVMVLLAGAIAPMLVADPSYAGIMAATIRVLALAVCFVPVLSAYRGFWQGRKEMTEYAFSQTFEQLIRVGFLLSSAFMVVYLFHLERKYALYFAVLSTSISALAAIVQIYFFDQKNFKEIQSEAKDQPYKGVKKKKLMKELIWLAIPYMITAVIGYSDSLFNSALLPTSLKIHGYTAAEVSVILSAVNYVGAKITSIPQVLSPGFTAALIPHVTEALTAKDENRIRNIVTQCVAIILFIGSFFSAIIAIYARDMYHVMFYSNNQELASKVLALLAIEGFMGTISPVTSSLMIALKMRRKVIRNLTLSALSKAITMIPLVWLLGYPGAIVSTLIAHAFVFGGNLYEIGKEYSLDFKLLAISTLKVIVALLIATVVSKGLAFVGITGVSGGKLLALVKLACNGLITMIVYFGVAEVLKIPQALFQRSFIEVIRRRVGR